MLYQFSRSVKFIVQAQLYAGILYVFVLIVEVIRPTQDVHLLALE